jgi:hypothetical protein
MLGTARLECRAGRWGLYTMEMSAALLKKDPSLAMVTLSL